MWLVMCILVRSMAFRPKEKKTTTKIPCQRACIGLFWNVSSHIYHKMHTYAHTHSQTSFRFFGSKPTAIVGFRSRTHCLFSAFHTHIFIYMVCTQHVVIPLRKTSTPVLPAVSHIHSTQICITTMIYIVIHIMLI